MNSELVRRVLFTLGALLVYRFGTTIPLPGVHRPPDHMVHLYAGAQISIFSLQILPYLTAAILIQLVSMVSSRLGALPGGGEAGRRKLTRYTFGFAVFLAAAQAFGIASGVQGIPGFVNEPGGLFLLSATVTLTGGTVFLIWLSEQITARGIGNGLALILFANVAISAPRAVGSMVESTWQGELSVGPVTLLAILWVALVGAVVFVERARRRVPVEFAARNLGGRLLGRQSTCLSLKLNSAGLMPAVVSSWLYLLPLMAASLLVDRNSPWLAAANGMTPGTHVAGLILSSVAIILLVFVYTSFVIDPERAADSLKSYGAAIPGVEPGEPTARHLDRIVSCATCIGAVYLAAVLLAPELLRSISGAPFYLGGASVLVVVCTVLDIETQVRGLTLTRPGGDHS